MKDKYAIIVHTFESGDIEGQYYWGVENKNGYTERSGFARTTLLAFGEASEAVEELKKENR